MDTNTMEFEVKIQGTRDGIQIIPASLDIDEWIHLMENARNILYPDSKNRPHIGIRIEEGSARLICIAKTNNVIQAHALLGEVNNNHRLNSLSPKQRVAIKNLQSFASSRQLSISLGKADDIDSGLFINKQTQLVDENPVWVKTELYLDGKITSIGGKSKSNIHIETEKFGQLVISTTEKFLEEDKKNRVYKKQTIRVEIDQNPTDFTYNTKSAKLLEFIEYEKEGINENDYLNGLIQKASKDWEDVEDSQAWLNEIRGYERTQKNLS